MPTQHETLFSAYVRELRSAKRTAEAWWRGLIDAEGDGGEARVRLRWPDGPPSHPLVVGVIQRYHRLCEELNDALESAASSDDTRQTASSDKPRRSGKEEDDDEEDEEATDDFVYPHVFVSEWLVDAEDLEDFIAGLSYWPIGLDKSGRII